MKNIKIYYGLSGAFKGTTIKSVETGPIMESAIKRWKYYQFGTFEGKTDYHDSTYGILHLVRLKDFLEGTTEQSCVVERGITDSIFYSIYNTELETTPEDSSFIKACIEEEDKLLSGANVQRILLVQKDYDFVRDVVLKEPSRKRTFKDDPDKYMELQDKYVRFTTTYNKIDKIININNAKEYIESLGLEYKPEN